MKRKVLSIVTALALCVGLLPVTARAVTADDFASLKNEAEAASAAVAVPTGIYDGNGSMITLPSGVSLTIASGQTVTLKNMTIKAGSNYSTAYTKIANYGTLTMENVNVVGDANTSYGGRGLANLGTAILKNCNFYHNRATDGTGLTGASYGTRGGGIYTAGPTLILDGCSFRENHNDHSGGYGGAVAVLGGTMYANNCVFSENTAGGTSNNGCSTIYNSSGTFKLLNCTVIAKDKPAFYTPNTVANCIILSTAAYSYTNCVNGTVTNATNYLNSATPTQKGDYGYYFPVKDDNNNAAKKGTLDTWFSYDADGGNVKMGYRTASTAGNYSSLISGTFAEPTDGTVNRANTYFEGGTRESNIVGASGLPYPIVTFNSNGGSAVESQQITSDSVVVARPTDPTRDGYTFDGWYSDAGLTTAYTFGSTIAESITLYAKWTITDPVTVTFNANGGNGTMAEQKVPRNIATPLDAMSGLTGPAGKLTFTGWNKAADGSGTPYADSAEITAADNITLYAQWSALQETDAYTVTDAGNLTVTLKEATVDNLQAALASAATTIIVPNALSLTAGMYNGAQNGKTSTAITLNASYGLTVPANNSVTLKNLTIQAGDGYSTTATKLTNSGTLTMENVVITGNGRGLSNTGGKVAVLKNCDICGNICSSGYGAGINNAGTLVLDGCSVSRNQNSSNGGGISASSGTIYANNTVFACNVVTSGAGAAICYGTLYLLNCTFVNNTSSNGSNGGAIYTDNNWYAVNCVFANNKHGTALQDASKAPTSGSNNLYTNNQDWSNNGGGNGTRTTAAAIFGEDTPDVNASASRPYGYYAPILDNDTTRGGVKTYFYYNDNASVIYMGYGSGNTQLVTVGTPSSDQIATAVTAYMESSSGRAANASGKYIIGASAPVLSVTYDANGGTGTMAGQTFTKGSTVTLTANSFTRVGYTFSGWNTVAGGTGIAYADEATTGALDTGIVLYAQWTANTYTVTLDKQGGTGGDESVTATYDAAMPSATTPTCEGYNFNGYYDAESDGTQYYTSAGTSARSWDKDANATLYAQWTAATYTVTLNTNDGTLNSGNVTSYTYGVGATLPTDVTKSGCTFGGWYEDSGFSGSAVTTIGTTDTGNKTYYAKWTTDPATAPTITTQPSSLNLTYGYTDGNTLTVAADSISEHTLSYQWYSNTTNSNEGGTAVGGATSASYTVPTGGSVGTTYYYCVVTATRTDNSEEASTTSSVATMTVGRASITPTVTISGYTYGDTVSEPSVSGNTGNGTVTYYYNTTNSTTGGTGWSDITPTRLNAGTYYLYAEVAETDNYNAATTAVVSFEISKADYRGTKTASTTVRSGQETASVTLELPLLPDGANYPGNGTVSNSGFITAHSISGTTLTYSTTSKDAETSATITIHVTGATNYNEYDVVVTVTAKAKDDAAASITGGDKTVTYGDSGFTLAGTVTNAGTGTGIWTWSSGNTSVATVVADTGAVTVVGQGTTTITANYESDTSIGKATMTLTVNKAALTVTANNNTITYGDAPAGNGVTYSGWKYSDTESVLTGTPSYSYDYSQYGNVGNNYAITPAGLSAANYNISYVPGTLTVQQKEVGLGWSNTTLTYSGSEQAPTATATGLVNGDAISVTVTGGQTDAGAYTATASRLTGDKAGNYKLPSAVTQSFTIGKATQSTPPTISSVTSEGVATLSAAPAEGSAIQYALLNAEGTPTDGDWQNATLDADRKFTVGGTSPSTTYYLYVRYAESANYNASTASASKSFTTPATCTVTFEVNGGSEVSPITGVESGATISAPTAPTKSGYTFGGWYKDSGLTTAWDFSTDTVTANITLYAKWTENIYTISFNANGGSVSSASAMTGTDGKLTSLPTPTRSGSYSFVGWYTAASGGTQVTLATVFSADATVYAHWTYTGGSSSDSSDSSYDYTPPSNTTTTSDNSTTTNADGSVTEATSRTTTTTNRDGSKTETTRETATTTATDGSTTTSDSTIATTTKTTGGTTTATTTATETATTKGADGSTTESKSESSTVTTTAADGSTTTTTSATETATTTTEDGSKTTMENKTDYTETLDASGNGTVESTITETVKDSEGSVTATTVTESTGTVSTGPDGTKTTVTTDTITTTTAAGETSVIETSTATINTPDGSTGKAVSDSDGNTISAAAAVSEKAVETAAESGEAVTLPVEVKAADTATHAAPIEITMPVTNEVVRVEIPVTNATPGTVAVIVHADGTEEVVKTSTNSADGVVLTLDGGATVKIVDNSREFIDVPETAWYADTVAWAASREVMNGTSKQMFSPTDTTNKAMMTQLLYNLDGAESDASSLPFSDVSESDWYAESASWAAETGVVSTNSDRFGGTEVLSREQVAVMLYNYAKSKGYNTSASGDVSAFTDSTEISAEARTALSWAVGAGLLNGKGNGILDPQGSATRAEIATVMERFCENVAI